MCDAYISIILYLFEWHANRVGYEVRKKKKTTNRRSVHPNIRTCDYLPLAIPLSSNWFHIRFVHFRVAYFLVRPILFIYALIKCNIIHLNVISLWEFYLCMHENEIKRDTSPVDDAIAVLCEKKRFSVHKNIRFIYEFIWNAMYLHRFLFSFIERGWLLCANDCKLSVMILFGS